ncbi:hypothetical protein predicted by Glimmer/Critica [Salmonella enterica subsp. enterica serovar Weltevreden str. 2007-60-3289-1]|nr:hypothetical protein predicted by Glimmer/Critica [Salmonella enterica subsp. enterica serovar Weltevreden str. 2007-60-3289-1]
MTSVAVTCEPAFAEVFTGRGCHPEFLRRFFQALKHFVQEGCYSAGNNEEKGNSFLPEKVVCWFTYHSEDIKTLHLR